MEKTEMCCDCIEKIKNELSEKGMYEVTFDNRMGKNKVLIPFSYRVKNQKNGELTQKVWKGRYIPKHCPFCGKQLRDGE